MNHQQLAEAAATVSARGVRLIESCTPWTEEPLSAWWIASKRRLHAWLTALERHAQQIEAAEPECREALRTGAGGVIAEVFVSEMLTRVGAAALVAADRRRGLRRAEPIARNVFAGHLEARRQALTLILEARDASPALAACDRLRHRCERWTDLLLGRLAARYAVDEFAFDAARCREFGREQLARESNGPAWTLVMAGLRAAFEEAPAIPAAHVELHRAVVQPLLAAFPAEPATPDGAGLSLPDRVRRSALLPEGPPRHEPPLTPGPTGRRASPGIRFSDLRRRRAEESRRRGKP